MQVRLTKDRIDSIASDNCGDSDGAWWIQGQIENSIEVIIELINEQLSKKNQVVIVPEEKYVKCTCQFKSKMENGDYGYREVYIHTSFCKEHKDEDPELYTEKYHMENCPECRAEHED